MLYVYGSTIAKRPTVPGNPCERWHIRMARAATYMHARGEEERTPMNGCGMCNLSSTAVHGIGISPRRAARVAVCDYALEGPGAPDGPGVLGGASAAPSEPPLPRNILEYISLISLVDGW